MVQRYHFSMVGILLVVPMVFSDSLAAQQRGGQQSAGQEARQEQEVPDTILAQLRTLQARLDSLEVLLRELRPGDPPEGPGRGRVRGGQQQARDELAALRAAARARVADAPPPDTVSGPSVLKSRNLNDFNPEISVTGDTRFVVHSP